MPEQAAHAPRACGIVQLLSLGTAQFVLALSLLTLRTSQRVWDGVVPPACAPLPTVLCLRPDGEAWEQAHEPLHSGVDAPGKQCGIGPGLAFSSALLREQPGRPTLGLVPCAVGGSALCEWELPAGELGRRAVARARAALAAAGDPVPARLALLLFHQGETDSLEAADADTWGERFVRWAASVRAELHAPELPVGVVAITASETACPHLETVRAAQLRVPAMLHRSFVVDAHGLELQADGLHLTTDAQVALGTMLARAFMKFEESCGV